MIDLTKIPLGQVDTYYEEYRLKSGFLFRQLDERNSTGYNRLVVPMSVYNIIITNDGFKWSGEQNSVAPMALSDKVYFGDCRGFECLLDINMRPDEIIMTYDTETWRDKKIDCVLGKRRPVQKKLRVKP